MRIGMDVRVLDLMPQRTGVANYAYRLIEALMPLAGSDQLHLYTDSRLAAGEYPPGARPRRLGFGLRSGWQQVRLPIAALQDRLHLLHSLNYAVSRWAPCPQVVTIYDLCFLACPDQTEPSVVRYLSRAVPMAVEKADAILAISDFTARELQQRLGVPAEKIWVTPLAVDSRFRPVGRERAARLLPGVDRYVLYVGSVGLRKNLSTLLEAFSRLCRQGFPHRLVLAGNRAYLSDEVEAAVAAHGLTERVIFAGYVSDGDLPALYAGADLFVFPSLYEGFGLPPLEAMACGTPVVCSQAASLPGVVGEAALMADPLSVDGLAEAMERVLSDPDTAARLRAAGLERVQHFTWNATATRTLTAYRAVHQPKVGADHANRP
jgi:glycosyltransferase involved in cell wall biosynthesis